ncbi:tumor necrosis factor receptor superfamily member 6B [Pyxicephalus adspersus]|uniref:tumor necrosis factor receptor superfamily member 6B n=1 Tax=Pyxicephalus adspersus TaxID=30357 RepID=UPI003B5A8F91
MNIFGLKLSFALLLIIVEGVFASTPTYQWIDQETGEVVTCQQCPQGTYVANHCTSTSKTKCQPCPEQHYTSYWNYVEKCRFCNVICEDREQIKHECNSTHNRICECKPGYRRDSDYCVRDCRNLTDIDDSECDAEVIKFVARQNLSFQSFQRLLKVVNERDVSGKKNFNQKKVRSLLRQIKHTDPNHALLPRLMELVKEANLTHLEKELRKRFLHNEEDGYIVPQFL